MARNAGFAFVAAFGEHLVNRVLRTYHANLVSPIPIPLPASVSFGGQTVTIAGELMLVAPQVTLRTRPDNLVQVSLAVAGQLVLQSGTEILQAQIILTTSLAVGLATIVNGDKLTVGLDLSSANVTSVTACILTGEPLHPTFEGALRSQQVLDSLTKTLRSIPPSLVQTTPTAIKLLQSVTQTYQPYSAGAPFSIFEPDVLFSVDLQVSRIVVRPVDSNDHTSGAIVVALDLQGFTNGDPASLVDLNTVPSPAGYSMTFQRGVSQSFGGQTSPHNTSFATAVNGDMLSALVDRISPQLTDKFVNDHVAFGSISIKFGWFNPPQPFQSRFGLVVTADMTYYQQTARNARGYIVPAGAGVGVTATIYSDFLLHIFEDAPWPQLSRPPEGSQTASVTFTTTPPGGYVQIDGAYVRDRDNAPNLAVGDHTLQAQANSFQAWSASGKVAVSPKDNTKATLTVTGDGSITLQESMWDPFLTQDFWSVEIVDVDIKLPFWLTLGLLLLGPLYLVGSLAASIFGVDIWLGTIIDNVETLVSRNISQSINGSLSTQPLVNPIQAVTQLPNTNAPNWWMTMNDMVLSAEGAENYVTATLFPPVLGTGSSFPYLLMTDQDVSSPDAVTTGERIDGQFFYPGISWGSPQQAQPSTWDVHKINPIGIVLKVPPGLFHPQDPTVYARWEVKRTDTGQTIISKNFGIGQAGAPANIFTVSIDHASAELQGADGFSIACQLYRPICSGVEQIFNVVLEVDILDHLDRHHPYVHWSHTVYVLPGYKSQAQILSKMHSDPTFKPYWSLYWSRDRVSRIHRTDVPGRCRETDRFWSSPPVPRALRLPAFYLDTLPVSLDLLRTNRDLARGVLCDYCFYGGPTRTKLLI